MSDIDRTRMIPLHIADQAVAACDAEIAKLREENARLKAEVERLTKQNDLATPRHLIASQDIKTLREQVERLKAELSNITGWGRGLESDLSWARAELMQVKAEVERLTKAGDAMAGSHITLIQVYLKDSSDEWHQELHNRWLAAKEGKPHA
jgi:chromosome segregation ATPase